MPRVALVAPVALVQRAARAAKAALVQLVALVAPELRAALVVKAARVQPEALAAQGLLVVPAARAVLISRCVTVNLVGGLDSHQGQQWSQLQGIRQEAGFNAIARLVDDLMDRQYDATSTWFDHTTIIGFSEFSRTPTLNVSGGRDHHITNSCFLLGGNVRGGQVIGASSNVGMQATNVSLQTGRVDPAGEVIRPEHVLRTLYDEVGIDDRPDLRVRGIEPLLKG